MHVDDVRGTLGNGYAEDICGQGYYPRGLYTPTSTQLSRLQHGATLLGISLEAYVAHTENGEKWCSAHKAWEPLDAFGKGSACRKGAAESAKRSYWRRKERAAAAPAERGV